MSDTYAGIGARKTPAEVQEFMTHIASTLADVEYTLRTGGAPGADCAFMHGVADQEHLMEIYIPHDRFNGLTTKDNCVHALLDMSDDLANKAWEIGEKFHPVWKDLDADLQLLIGRNAFQLLGPDLETPSNFVVCWTPSGKTVGGTGQAIRIAQHYEIPIINLGSLTYNEAIDMLNQHV